MSKEQYNRNRLRLAEIQGVDLSKGTHNCHHAYITRHEAKLNPRLRKDLDKIENLFLLPISEHNRLHAKLERTEPHTQLPRRRRSGRQRRKRR